MRRKKAFNRCSGSLVHLLGSLMAVACGDPEATSILDPEDPGRMATAGSFFEFVDLGPGDALAINNGGQILLERNCRNVVGPHRVVCDYSIWEEGREAPIGCPGIDRAGGLNDAGQILTRERVDNTTWIFGVCEDGVLTELPEAFETYERELRALNDRGEVGGTIPVDTVPDPFSGSPDKVLRGAVIWRDGVLEPVECSNADLDCAVVVLNDRNDFAICQGDPSSVGTNGTQHCERGAALYLDGQRAVRLGARPGAVNSSGQFVGGFANDAFLWEDGVLTLLDSGRFDTAIATDINDSGQIVGMGVVGGVGVPNFAVHALFWSGGRVLDVHPPRWPRSRATALDDAGTIIGWVEQEGGAPTRHAALWRPRASVPGPAGGPPR